MNKRNKSKNQSVPFSHNDLISIHYQWTHGRDEILPGDKIMFKSIRGKFTFIKVVDNRDRGVTWIDCIEEKTHTFRSFYVDRLKGKVKPKRPRRKSV